MSYDVSAVRAHFPALAEGAAAGERKYGSRVRFIPDIARQMPETQFAVLEFVLRARDAGLAIGLTWWWVAKRWRRRTS